MADPYIFATGSESEVVAAIQRRRLRANTVRQHVDEGFAHRLTSIAQRYPTLTPEAAVPLAMAGLDGSHPALEQVAQLEHEEMADVPEAGGWFNAASAWMGRTGKGAVRVGFTGWDVFWHDVVTRPMRAAAHAANVASQGGRFRPDEFIGSLDEGLALSGNSEGVLAIRNLLRGERVDLGEGFFSGGEIGEEAQRQREQIRVAGQPVTLGTLTGLAVYAATPEDVELLEPGSRGFEIWRNVVDVAHMVLADPAAAGLGAVSKARRAAKGFGQTENLGFGFNVGRHVDEAGEVKFGLVRGQGRNTFLPEVVNGWLDTAPEARQLVDKLVEETSGRHIFEAFGHRLVPDVARGLAQADEASQVRGILRGILGQDIATVPRLKKVRDGMPRFFRLMPGQVAPTQDARLGWVEVDRYLTNVKASPAVRDEAFDAWAAASDNLDFFRFGEETLAPLVEAQLIEAGAAQSAARRLTRLWGEGDDYRRFVVDTMADDSLAQAFHRTVNVGGTHHTVDLRLLSEALHGGIPLPNVRELRAATSHPIIRGAVESTPGQLAIAANDAFLRAWIPAQLIRGAWAVRVIGEEQVRMAVAGLDSAFRHPVQALAWMLAAPGELPEGAGVVTRAKRAVGDVARAVVGEAGANLTDDVAELQQAMSRTMDGYMFTRPGKVASGLFDEVGQSNPRFYEGFANDLRRLHLDPVARKFASGLDDADLGVLRGLGVDVDELDDLTRFREWFWQGGGEGHRGNIARMLGAPDLETSRAASDAYADWVRGAVMDKTGGQVDLIEAIAKGNLAGQSIRNPLTAAKAEHLLGGFQAPERVAVEILADSKRTGWLDHLVQVLFDGLMSRPSNFLSRQPTFRQSYWTRMREMAGLMDEATQQRLLKEAEEAFRGLGGKKELAAIREAVAQGSGSKLTSWTHADDIAKSYGLDETRNLLYDLARRSQWVDATRGFLVFAEAWKEIATTWARLLVEQPQTLRRAQQGVEGARDLGVTYPGENGEEMFAYPLGRLFSPMLGWGPVEVVTEGRVAGLNLFSQSFLPGFGPLAQVAVSKLLPDTPDLDWLREWVLPFGESDPDLTPGGFLNEMLPAWMQKVVNGISEGALDSRVMGNTRFDVMRAMTINEGYTTDSEEELARLWEDSKSKSKWLMVVRGALQNILPTGPQIKFVAADANGDLFSFQVLTEEYYKLFEAAGGDHAEATRQFTSRFGFEPHLLRQGKSRSIRKRAVTKPGALWERQHPDVVKAFPLTVGFFAPEDFEEEFDFDAYLRAIDAGDRETLTPEQMTLLANNTAGWAMRRHAIDQLEAAGVEGEAAQAALKAIDRIIEEHYPGYRKTDTFGIGVKPRREHVIEELERAVGNPTIAATDAGKGARLYLDARRQLLDVAASRGFKTLGGQQVADLRTAARDIAAAIVDEHPGFAAVWDEVLSREVDIDDEEETADAA